MLTSTCAFITSGGESVRDVITDYEKQCGLSPTLAKYWDIPDF